MVSLVIDKASPSRGNSGVDEASLTRPQSLASLVATCPPRLRSPAPCMAHAPMQNAPCPFDHRALQEENSRESPRSCRTRIRCRRDTEHRQTAAFRPCAPRRSLARPTRSVFNLCHLRSSPLPRPPAPSNRALAQVSAPNRPRPQNETPAPVEPPPKQVVPLNSDRPHSPQAAHAPKPGRSSETPPADRETRPQIRRCASIPTALTGRDSADVPKDRALKPGRTLRRCVSPYPAAPWITPPGRDAPRQTASRLRVPQPS